MNPLKAEAQKLRDSGYSYNMINSQLGIAKSTLNNWFRDRFFTPNKEVLDRIQYGPIKSAAIVHNRKVEEIKRLGELGAREIGVLSRRDIWLLGLGLYIGEGAKTNEVIRIVNSNPEIIKLSIRWFKEICGLEDKNITVYIHIYPDNDIWECFKFWSKVTGLPIENFRKIQIDTRENKLATKRKKLPHGTAHISIISKGNPEKGVKLYRRINGWITGVLTQT